MSALLQKELHASNKTPALCAHKCASSSCKILEGPYYRNLKEFRIRNCGPRFLVLKTIEHFKVDRKSLLVIICENHQTSTFKPNLHVIFHVFVSDSPILGPICLYGVPFYPHIIPHTLLCPCSMLLCDPCMSLWSQVAFPTHFDGNSFPILPSRESFKA